LPDPLTDVECRLISHMASTLGVVTAVLKQVPNEPITFTNDPERKSRSGASIIAYTLRAILEGTVDEYHSIALFPMVKSVVRAMDTVTNFTDQSVTRFYVSGAAERGWVTWLTAAVDDRIVGIAPLVYGNLNFVKNLKHQQRSLGGYSWGISPYWEQNITHYIDEPTRESILSVLEPLAYNKFLTMPKYIVLSSNDEQYMPDCTKYFYQSMKEPVFLRIYPNTDNSLLGSWNRMVNDFTGFILSVEEKKTLPDVRWKLTETNDAVTVSIKTNLRPLSFTKWVADTPTDARRDFRLRIAKSVNMSESIPQSVLFQKTKTDDPGVEFETTLAKPSNGWVGIFIEIVFPAPNGTHFTVTTDMSVIPDVYPLEEDCSGDSCVGRLV
ncbi:putative autocrine proliferation repressor protein A-like, partial [Apostichopus japonicus]